VSNFPLLWWPICQWGIITFIEPNICESCLLAKRQAKCYHAQLEYAEQIGTKLPMCKWLCLWESRRSFFCFDAAIHAR